MIQLFPELRESISPGTTEVLSGTLYPGRSVKAFRETYRVQGCRGRGQQRKPVPLEPERKGGLRRRGDGDAGEPPRAAPEPAAHASQVPLAQVRDSSRGQRRGEGRAGPRQPYPSQGVVPPNLGRWPCLQGPRETNTVAVLFWDRGASP